MPPPSKNKQENLLKVNSQMIFLLFLSLLSDSNQRPRDYKSRALANVAKEAFKAAALSSDLRPVGKRLQSYYLFLNYLNFSKFFLVISQFFLEFLQLSPH